TLVREPADRVAQRDVRAGDGRRTGTAVGLQHVAVEDDGVLAERLQVDARPQAAPDQAGDIMGTPTDAPLHALPVATGVRGARQHRVLGGHPAEPGTLAPAR